MNKQELIEKYEEKYANESQLDNLSISRAVLFKNVVRELKNLELDEPQKVKIPKFVAEYLEHVKRNEFSLFRAINGTMPSEIRDWRTSKKYELFARAWLDGYEVKKEPTWVVRGVNGYFFSFSNTPTDTSFGMTNVTGRFAAYRFADKSKAEALALLIDGTVEEL